MQIENKATITLINMQYDKVVHLEKAGTLTEHISKIERDSLHSLKITGVINKSDVDDVLNEMCTSEGDYEGDPEDDIWVVDEKHSPRLRYLDLSGCRFVGGTKFPYMGWYPLLEYFAFPQGIEYACDEYDSGLECATKLKTVVLPEGIKNVGQFHGCENLEEINLPESIETIDDFAFNFCRKLKHLQIPRNVNYIGAGAFAQCGIKEFDIDPDNPYFTTVDGVIFTKDLKTIVAFPPISKTHYDIPFGTEIIGGGAFEDCNLETVHIPDSVTRIETFAFQCSGLREVYLPDSVTEIGDICFRGSSELESMRLSQNISILGNQAISGCKKLKEIDIPASVKKMDLSNIVWNESLERVCLHNGLEEITGEGPCICRIGQLKEISLPKTLRRIPGGMFHHCHHLKNFNLDPGNPFFTTIGDAIYSHNKTRLVAVPDSQRKAFAVPEGVEEIGELVFSYFYRLENVELPNTLRKIGHRAFDGCKSLREIIIPAGLNVIDFRAFDECEMLDRLVCRPVEPPQLENYNIHRKFLDAIKNVIVMVPAESLPLYQNAEGWKDVKLVPFIDE